MDGKGPKWGRLYEVAAAQEGHFMTSQAARAGYSPQLLAKYLANGRIQRCRRGVYRIVHYPAGEHEDLVVLWLWSERKGVFSHETALFLHELSSVLPAKVHMTVPSAWRRRRLRVPGNLRLVYDDLLPTERTWFGCLPVTAPARAVRECVQANVSPELIEQAVDDGVARGLFSRDAFADAGARAQERDA